MIEDGKSNGVIYVQVSRGEYYHLISTKERLEVLKDYMESTEYPEKTTIKTILGIKEEEKSNE